MWRPPPSAAFYAEPHSRDRADDLAAQLIVLDAEQPPQQTARWRARRWCSPAPSKSLTRDEAKAQAERLGAKVSGSVSKRTDLVVAGSWRRLQAEDGRRTGDRKCITEDEWLALVGGLTPISAFQPSRATRPRRVIAAVCPQGSPHDPSLRLGLGAAALALLFAASDHGACRQHSEDRRHVEGADRERGGDQPSTPAGPAFVRRAARPPTTFESRSQARWTSRNRNSLLARSQDAWAWPCCRASPAALTPGRAARFTTPTTAAPIPASFAAAIDPDHLKLIGCIIFPALQERDLDADEVGSSAARRDYKPRLNAGFQIDNRDVVDTSGVDWLYRVVGCFGV